MSRVKYVKDVVDKEKILACCTPLISEKIIESSLCQECVIENYSKLKEKITYTMTSGKEFPERTLKLYKNKKNHCFQFHCELTNSDITKMTGNLSNTMNFYIKYDKDKTICPGDLQETHYGFSIEVPNEIVRNPDNKYLKENDKVIIEFRYRDLTFVRGAISRNGVSKTEDEVKLSKDLFSLYESGEFADLIIFDGEDKEHFVHKSICKSRSLTIRNDEFAVGIPCKSRHVDIAIRYMYSGILPNLPLDDLLEVLQVAERLGIKSLLKSLQQILLEILNKSNARKIYDAISEYDNMGQIEALAEYFLPYESEQKRRGRR